MTWTTDSILSQIFSKEWFRLPDSPSRSSCAGSKRHVCGHSLWRFLPTHISSVYTDNTALCAVAHGGRYICTIHRDARQGRNIRNVNTNLPTIVRRGKNHNSNRVPDAPCHITSPTLFPPIIFPIFASPRILGNEMARNGVFLVLLFSQKIYGWLRSYCRLYI